MRIQSSDCSFSSTDNCSVSHQTRETLSAWDSETKLVYDSASSSEVKQARYFNTKDIVDLESLMAPQHHDLKLDTEINAAEGIDTTSKRRSQLLKDVFIGTFREHMIKNIVERMTGKKIHVFNMDETAVEDTENSGVTETGETKQSAPAEERQGWGVDYHFHETTHTTEGFVFAASGTLTTDDGRSIDFSASLEMQRETYEELSVSFKAGDALIDPLIIHLDSSAGNPLSDNTVTFDLDADGMEETVHTPGIGNGFLAIDKNDNGIIDNGSELFGPSTGNGFDELAFLDEDGNGWIDESDTAFGTLKIWRIASKDAQSLTSLQQNNIGAIAVQRAATSYTLFDSSKSPTGIIRETGVYLSEQGTAGIIQEVDIAV